MFDTTIETAQSLIVLAGVAAIVYSVFKNSTVRATITSQKDLIETLTVQVNELRKLHKENEKSIQELKGQVSVYKELPLADLAQTMKNMSKQQEATLAMLKEIKKGS